MYKANVLEVAGKVLDERGQTVVAALLQAGRIDEAKERVLRVIDSAVDCKMIPVLDAEDYYNLLDLPPERASRFHQLNLDLA